jgi:hypothetical protein
MVPSKEIRNRKPPFFWIRLRDNLYVDLKQVMSWFRICVKPSCKTKELLFSLVLYDYVYSGLLDDHGAIFVYDLLTASFL